MALAFIIQAHVISEQLIEQTRLFLDREHRVILSLDTEQTSNVLSALAKAYKKLTLINSMPVTWCGLSQVHAYMNCLAAALQFSDWAYVINLSGDCLLYRPAATLEKYMGELAANGVQGLVSSFDASKICNLDYSVDVKGFERGRWLTIPRYANRNITLVIPEVIRSEWEDVSSSPIVKAGRRFAYHAMDDFHQRTLIVRPLFVYETNARRAFVSRNGLRIGRSWFAFSSMLVKRLVMEAPLTATWNLFSEAFEPDEYLIHNLLTELSDAKIIQDRNLQVDGGRTKRLDQSEVKALLAEEPISNSTYFIRKITLEGKALEFFKREIWPALGAEEKSPNLLSSVFDS